MEEKIFEASKSEKNKMEVTYAQVSNLMLSEGFMMMLKRLKLGEELYHNDTMVNYKRIK
jgi:hypothetical protein